MRSVQKRVTGNTFTEMTEGIEEKNKNEKTATTEKGPVTRRPTPEDDITSPAREPEETLQYIVHDPQETCAK